MNWPEKMYVRRKEAMELMGMTESLFRKQVSEGVIQKAKLKGYKRGGWFLVEHLKTVKAQLAERV